ncbi:MAG: signal peptide peptidase SppA [Desulfobacteraceae bacterium]|nr:signal peptide peptidase SppA [Desulfobacteraceae bacterium]
MSTKKRPILTVIIILGIAVLFLGTLMTIVLTFFGPSADLTFGTKIGVITIEGPIMESQSIVSQIVKFRRNKGIKAIILRIDSPGGGVGPSQEIYREVRRTIKAKRVIVSMGSLAASGGYYVAAGADKIVASPGTITGSIGVIMQFVQLKELLKKIGVGLEVLKSGEFKDVGSPHREMSEREKELLQELIFDIQDQFVKAVAEGRNLSVEEVQEIADGRVFSGAKAKELGLVDVLGNFQDAVDLAKKETGIEGEVTLVYPKKAGPSIWDLILRDTTRAVYEFTIKALQTHIEYRWDGIPQSLESTTAP